MKVSDVGMYENSKIWQRVMTDNGEHDAEKERLRVAFDVAHKNAAILAGEINRFLPEFTVHDITHIDALWTMTDIFLSEEYPLNPAEVFVLGVSFLIHDLGMGLAAYAGGIEGLRNETIWRDTVAFLCKKRRLDYDLDRIETIDKEIQDEATANTLRTLHAKKAEQLGLMSWEIEDSGKTEHLYIIEDSNLRSGYGEWIGKIAASHGWGIDRVKEELLSISSGSISGLPADWTVDLFKLACIVRIADAINIDDSRAPKLLRAARSPKPYSDLHWIFQQKLSQPQLKDNRIAFSSKTSFSIDERDAWWLCYDTLKWIDKEIRSVDSALAESGIPTFQCVGIYAVDNIADLTRRIQVNGWNPVDTSIRATQVAHLVEMLGGKFLYRGQKYAPLRELIQNASDAIRARRCKDSEDKNYGTILITIGEQNGEKYLEVEDDGIGMSPETMVNTLLDFGHSFWGSDEMHAEFPGLEQTSFESTGQFGIGFFSVFMWGSHVVVTSNRYDFARRDTHVLEFVAGFNERPFLRKANPDEYIRNGGTRIRIYLSDPGVIKEETIGNDLQCLCISIDCNIEIKLQGSRKRRIINANEWMTMDSETFLKRCSKHMEQYPEIYEFMCKSVRPVFENGECVGRIGVGVDELYYTNNRSRLYCFATVGGLYAENYSYGIWGVLLGKTTNVSRDGAMPIVSETTIDTWAQEQAVLVNESHLSDARKLMLADILCGITRVKTNVEIAKFNGQMLNFDDLEKYVKNHEMEEYVVLKLDANYGYEHYYLHDIPDCIICVDCELYKSGYKESKWETIAIGSKKVRYIEGNTSLYWALKAIANGWNMDMNDLAKKSECNDGIDKTIKKRLVKNGLMSGDTTVFVDVYVVKKN